MNAFRSIRQRLGLTQAQLADAMSVSQGNVSFYERGQPVPPDRAKRLIEFAKTKGVALTYDDIYADVPEEPAAFTGPGPTASTTA